MNISIKIAAIKQWDRSVVSMVIANFWPKIKPDPKWLAIKICDILATKNINDAHFKSLANEYWRHFCVSHDRRIGFNLPEMLSILLTWKMIGIHEIRLWHIVQMRTKKKWIRIENVRWARWIQKFVQQNRRMGSKCARKEPKQMSNFLFCVDIMPEISSHKNKTTATSRTKHKRGLLLTRSYYYFIFGNI